MIQMTLDDYLGLVPECCTSELLCCSLSQGFHWLRITNGYTPPEFKNFINFRLDGYDHLYLGTSLKEKVVYSFNGTVKDIPYSAIQ